MQEINIYEIDENNACICVFYLKYDRIIILNTKHA